MSDELARAAMYAVRGLVGAMREAGILNEDFFAAVDEQTRRHLHLASVLDTSAASPPNPAEATAIRHGMWWLRECVAPTGDSAPDTSAGHPRNFHQWPVLGEPWPDDDAG